MLQTLINNTKTDKNTIHSYLDTYNKVFERIKTSAQNVLEIGIHEGGSIKLWYDYFTNANIYGLDIIHINNVSNECKNNNRINLITSTDGYDEKIIKEKFIDKNIKFDMIMDDGPHTIESQCFFAKHYSQLLSDCGILVIEDVQDMNWVKDITNSFPEEFRNKIEIVDLRNIKNRYDDILIILDKSKL